MLRLDRTLFPELPINITKSAFDHLAQVNTIHVRDSTCLRPRITMTEISYQAHFHEFYGFFEQFLYHHTQHIDRARFAGNISLVSVHIGKSE